MTDSREYEVVCEISTGTNLIKGLLVVDIRVTKSSAADVSALSKLLVDESSIDLSDIVVGDKVDSSSNALVVDIIVTIFVVKFWIGYSVVIGETVVKFGFTEVDTLIGLR